MRVKKIDLVHKYTASVGFSKKPYLEYQKPKI